MIAMRPARPAPRGPLPERRALTRLGLALLPASLLGSIAALGSGCTLLPEARPITLLDLGPLPPAVQPVGPPMDQPAVQPTGVRPPLVLEPIEVVPSLASTAILWRPGNAPVEIHRYRDSRWAAPPAALVDARLRARLTEHWTLLATAPSSATRLQLRIETFEHRVPGDGPGTAVMRLQASLRSTAAGLQQRSFEASEAVRGPGARGAAAALSTITDALALNLHQWLAQSLEATLARQNPAPAR